MLVCSWETILTRCSGRPSPNLTHGMCINCFPPALGGSDADILETQLPRNSSQVGSQTCTYPKSVPAIFFLPSTRMIRSAPFIIMHQLHLELKQVRCKGAGALRGALELSASHALPRSTAPSHNNPTPPPTSPPTSCSSAPSHNPTLLFPFSKGPFTNKPNTKRHNLNWTQHSVKIASLTKWVALTLGQNQSCCDQYQ